MQEKLRKVQKNGGGKICDTQHDMIFTIYFPVNDFHSLPTDVTFWAKENLIFHICSISKLVSKNLWRKAHLIDTELVCCMVVIWACMWAANLSNRYIASFVGTTRICVWNWRQILFPCVFHNHIKKNPLEFQRKSQAPKFGQITSENFNGCFPNGTESSWISVHKKKSNDVWEVGWRQSAWRVCIRNVYIMDRACVCVCKLTCVYVSTTISFIYSVDIDKLFGKRGKNCHEHSVLFLSHFE